MKCRCDHLNCNRNLSNFKFYPENKIAGLQHGFKSMASAYVSAAVLYQLSRRQTCWEQTNLLIEFILTRDRNDTCNEVDLNRGNTDQIEM